MKNLLVCLTVLTFILFLSGCPNKNPDPKPKAGLVPVHITKNSDTSANISFDSEIENVLEKEIPLEFKAGAKWEQIKTTQYVLPAMAALIAQGKMKVVVSQEKTADGGIKSSISFEPISTT